MQKEIAFSRFTPAPDVAGESTVFAMTPRYSDMDVNAHVNNTRYAAFVCDFLPEPEKRRVVRFSLSYLTEAAAGEILKVYRADAGDGVFFFRTVRRDGKTNLEAEIVTEEVL